MECEAVLGERELWTFRIGDAWTRIWLIETTHTYDLASLVVQVTSKTTQGRGLIASTANGEGYEPGVHALIETVGSDFTPAGTPVDPKIFVWSVTADSSRLAIPGKFHFAAKCLIDSAPTTFMPFEDFEIESEWATLATP